MAAKSISIDPPFDAWFFFEIDCPICRYAYYTVMLPLQTDGYIKLRTFEIKANAGTPEVDWFNGYSEWGQESLTPTIRLVDRHIVDFKIREYPIQVLHLWETKGTALTDSDIEKVELLKKQIIGAVQNYKRRIFEDCHDKKRYPKLMVPEGLKVWPVGST